MKPVIDSQPTRRLDHDWFAFRTAGQARVPAVDCKLIVSLVVVLQHFPIDAKAPFAVPGALDRPYPDLGNYTQRESGLGHALWRLTDEIEAVGVPASFVIERQALPWLADIQTILSDSRHCLVAGGEHAVRLHTKEMDRDTERRIIADCLRDVGTRFGRPVAGWRSPYGSQSPATLELLAEAGVRYVGDFSNDDRPFGILAGGRPLLAIPMNHFYSDLHFIHACRQHVEDYTQATVRAAEWLAEEGLAAPSVLSLAVHPWIMGATHRVSAFAALLRSLLAMRGVQFMNSDQICVSSMDNA